MERFQLQNVYKKIIYSGVFSLPNLKATLLLLLTFAYESSLLSFNFQDNLQVGNLSRIVCEPFIVNIHWEKRFLPLFNVNVP